ncbi:MAG: hypothetical protein KIS76_02145 [Pyrinomonadaceae bacterium]|nr:hypothetical protein [Pyrinomonadaceae bacterium]
MKLKFLLPSFPPRELIIIAFCSPRTDSAPVGNTPDFAGVDLTLLGSDRFLPAYFAPLRENFDRLFCPV